MVFQWKDVHVSPGRGRRPPDLQVFSIQGNLDINWRIWFNCKTTKKREELSRQGNFSQDFWIICLTYVLQHEAGQIGAALVGINGRDVDDVICEEFQVGQVTEPQLETRDTTVSPLCSLIN